MLTNFTYQNTLVIVANSQKDKIGYGNYLRIISILPNLKFKNFFWISDNKPIELIKNSKIITKAYNLKSLNAKKLLKKRVSILNLFEKKKNLIYKKYLQNFLNKNQNIKESGMDLCNILLRIYKIRKYKLYHEESNENLTTDIFINYIVPKKWKIKEYPLTKFKLLIKKLKQKNKDIKISWQKKNDRISDYVNKIKNTRILLTIIGLGTHIGMMYKKRMVVLAGPTFFKDLNIYKNKIVFLPKKKCDCQTIYLNKGIYCKTHFKKKKSCMEDIDEKKLLKILLLELKKKN